MVELDFSVVERLADVVVVEQLHVDMAAHLDQSEVTTEVT